MFRRPKRLITDARARLNHFAHHQRVVGTDDGGQFKQVFFAVRFAGEVEFLLVGVGRQDGGQTRHFFRRFRHAVAPQEIRRGEQGKFDFRQRARNQRRGQGLGNAQRQIHAFGNQIDVAVVQNQF